MRQLTSFSGLVALFFATPSMAIGLGHLQLHSALGQPLQAEIPIKFGETAFNANEMRVNLALVGDDELPGARGRQLVESDYHAKIIQSSNGQAGILITSNSSLDSPYVRLVIDLKTPKGHLSREYTVLLDPPEFASDKHSAEFVALNHAINDKPQFVQPQLPIAAPLLRATTTTKTPKLTRHQEKRAAMLAKQQARKRVAKQAHQAQQEQISVTNNGMQAIVKPAASSSAVTHPAASSSAVTPPATEQSGRLTEFLRKDNLAKLQSVPSTDNAAAEHRYYGPTKRDETLWSILKKLPKYKDVSLAQMQFALLKRNPSAFIQGNINGLKADVTLQIPTLAEIQSIERDQASVREASQSHAWSEIHQQFKTMLAEDIDDVIKLDSQKSEQPQVITQLALIAKNTTNSHTETDAIDVARTAESAKPLVAITEAPVNQVASIDSDTKRLLSSIHDNIVGTVGRVDALQQGQEAMLKQTTHLKAKQQNLENYLDAKNIELAQMDTRLRELTQQLTLLNEKIKVSYNQQPIAVPTAQSGGWVMSNMGSMLGFSLLAGSVIGGLWYLRRKSWVMIGDDDDFGSVEYEDMEAQSRESKESVSVRNQNTDVSDADYDVLATNEEEFEAKLSPIDEADVLIQHRRYEQAEAILKDAIKSYPKRLDFYQKLLEVYAATDQRSAFDTTSLYLTDNLNISDKDMLQTIHTLRVLTWPDSKASKIDPAQDDGQTHQSHLRQMNFTPPMADFNSKIDEDVTKYAAKRDNHADIEREMAETFDAEDPLNAYEDSVQAPAEQQATKHKGTGLTLRAEADAPTAELDLAKTYIELQDFDSAIELLQKVKLDGDEQERTEAERLLRKIC